jgi:hypothetical protein
LDPNTNQWSEKTPMPTARHGMKLVLREGKVWAIGGASAIRTDKVEIYDVTNDTWETGPSLTTARLYPSAWVANDRIYVAGGLDEASNYLNSIEINDPISKQWNLVDHLPENKYVSDATVIGGKVYVVSGRRSANDYSHKVFVADLKPPISLYYRTAGSGGTPSAGSVTLDMLSPEVKAKLNLGVDTAFSAHPFTHGLVAWYPFNGNANDMTGNGHDGTVTGATLGADRHGVAGMAYSFDGDEDFISLANPQGLAKQVASVAFWVKANTDYRSSILSLNYEANQTVNADISIGNNRTFTLENEMVISARRDDAHFLGTNPLHTIYNIVGYVDDERSGLFNEAWHHVVMTYSGEANGTSVYVDGTAKPVSLGDLSFPMDPGKFAGLCPVDFAYIGILKENGNFRADANASIDELRIYDRALSSAEVVALYQLESGGVTTSAPVGATLFMPYGVDGEPVIGGSTYTVPDGKVLITGNYFGYIRCEGKFFNRSDADSKGVRDLAIFDSGTSIQITNRADVNDAPHSGGGFSGLLFNVRADITPILGETGYTVPNNKKLYILSSADTVSIDGIELTSSGPTIGKIPIIVPSGKNVTVDQANSIYGFTGYLKDN